MNDQYKIELEVFVGNTWNDLTVCKQMRSGSLKDYIT